MTTPAPSPMTKPSRAAVERPRGRLRVVVAGRQRAHRREAADGRLVDRGLGAAGDHHVRVAAPDDLARLADRVAAGRAGGHGREVRSGHPELDGDLAGPDVRDAHRDEERADPVGAAQGVRGEAVDERPDAAEPGAQDDPGPLGELALEPIGQAGLVERLAGGHQPELDVAVRPAQLLAVEDAARVEVLDLGGEPGGEPRRVERSRSGGRRSARRRARPRSTATSLPSAVTSPMPVTTTRRRSVAHRTSFPVRTVAAR